MPNRCLKISKQNLYESANKTSEALTQTMLAANGTTRKDHPHALPWPPASGQQSGKM